MQATTPAMAQPRPKCIGCGEVLNQDRRDVEDGGWFEECSPCALAPIVEVTVEELAALINRSTGALPLRTGWQAGRVKAYPWVADALAELREPNMQAPTTPAPDLEDVYCGHGEPTGPCEQCDHPAFIAWCESTAEEPEHEVPGYDTRQQEAEQAAGRCTIPGCTKPDGHTYAVPRRALDAEHRAQRDREVGEAITESRERSLDAWGEHQARADRARDEREGL